LTASKTLSGARAQLIVADSSGVGKVVGIFSSVSFGVNYDTQPIYILGRYSAAETVYTAQETVSVSATGFRALDAGAHVSVTLPQLQDLLNAGYIELAIFERQSQRMTAKIHEVRPTGYSTGVSARGIQEITVNFIGLRIDDESSNNTETPGASELS
jgi:hypothetical protein